MSKFITKNGNKKNNQIIKSNKNKTYNDYQKKQRVEQFLAQQKAAIVEKIQKGLDDAAAGRLSDRGSFAQYVKEE